MLRTVPYFCRMRKQLGFVVKVSVNLLWIFKIEMFHSHKRSTHRVCYKQE